MYEGVIPLNIVLLINNFRLKAYKSKDFTVNGFYDTKNDQNDIFKISIR